MRHCNSTELRPSVDYLTLRRRWTYSACLLLGSALIAPAYANTYTVGSTGCSHTSIAAALATAESHPGPDTIRIARSATYSQQAINFTTSQELTLTGGFADCSTNTEDSIRTSLNGAGGAALPVLTINGNTGSLIHLRKLSITGGDVPNTDTAGGGIQYTGNGLLDIADTGISNNHGAYGGGINAAGTGNDSELDIGPNTTISNNIAWYNGGGIYSNNIETAIRGSNISIIFNQATGVQVTGVGSVGGAGGGIDIRSCAYLSSVFLASPDVGSLGVVSYNTAKYGGGVAIETPSGCSKPADLRMYSTATGPTSLSKNSASVRGGGVYIYRAGGTANVYVWNASLDDNDAPEGAALYLGDSGNAYFNEAFPPGVSRPDEVADCTLGVPCGTLKGNIGTTGQVIYGPTNNKLELYRVGVTGNKGTELIRINDLEIAHSLIADNISNNRLIESHDATVSFSSVAGNQIAGTAVFGTNTGGNFILYNSVIWQPSKSILHNDGVTPTVGSVIANEIASLAGSGTFATVVANPRFIDPFNADYRPTAGSPLVDFAVGGSGVKDLLSQPRGVDLDLVANRFGTGDLGAYERQAVQPLAENGQFEINARVWTIFSSSVTTWDPTQNAPGSLGGSLHIKQTTSNPDVVGAAQCIHLPGPGDYSLNASGKVASGTAMDPHFATVGWELRLAGSEACTGNPNLYGDKVVAATGNSWNRPSTPAHIVVTPQQWTRDTSVIVYLKINESGGLGGINAPTGTTLKEGWIDRVTLTVEEAVTDRIFFDGFDPISASPAE